MSLLRYPRVGVRVADALNWIMERLLANDAHLTRVEHLIMALGADDAAKGQAIIDEVDGLNDKLDAIGGVTTTLRTALESAQKTIAQVQAHDADTQLQLDTAKADLTNALGQVTSFEAFLTEAKTHVDVVDTHANQLMPTP